MPDVSSNQPADVRQFVALDVRKPGGFADTSDAAWLCRLLEHGLLRKSFVPREIRELRDLARYRKGLIRERASEVHRLHKVLEDAGGEARDGRLGRGWASRAGGCSRRWWREPPIPRCSPISRRLK